MTLFLVMTKITFEKKPVNLGRILTFLERISNMLGPFCTWRFFALGFIGKDIAWNLR